MPKCEFHDEAFKMIHERIDKLEEHMREDIRLLHQKIDKLNNRWTDKALAFLCGILGVLTGWFFKK